LLPALPKLAKAGHFERSETRLEPVSEIYPLYPIPIPYKKTAASLFKHQIDDRQAQMHHGERPAAETTLAIRPAMGERARQAIEYHFRHLFAGARQNARQAAHQAATRSKKSR
jgi:hypothetical protein